ncbi:MAG: ABC transporter substrate-binding protein [Candidatus Rokubacteria bacterium]|nr:ABC transporter substrate-binding protein [Candidatus Rokubacteria bacterium]
MADETFSFEEVSRRALGLHWQRRTPAEREEFVRLFADLLERSYIGKIELYSGEKVRYVGETVEDGRATVRTKIVTRQGNEVPVDYQMLPRGDRWVVYDVKIEGVSLVGNYRTQFDRIIQTSSYQTLVTKLKTSKDEALETARAGARN